MQNASFRRHVFLVALVAVLAAPWASAAGGLNDDRPAEAAASPLDLLGRFWTILKSAWSATGSHLDPDGVPAPRTDEGCRLDPDGRCAPAPQPQTDEGCRIDPSGGCGA